MSRVRGISLALAAVTLMMASAAACGGNDDDNGGDGAEEPGTTATAPATSDAGDAPTVAPEPTTATDGQPVDGAGEDAEAAEAFQEVIGRFASATFKAEYTVALDPAAELQNASMTMQKDGPERLRTDIRAEQGGQPIELIVIDTPEASGFCFKDAGEFGELFDVPPGEGVCFENDPTGGGFGGLSEALSELQGPNVQVLDQSERTIAGMDAACFTVRDDEQTDEACFAENGTLLAVDNEDGTSLEATTVSGDIDGDAFTLPYEAREFPDLGGAPQ